MRHTPRDGTHAVDIREILVLHHSHLDMGFTHSQAAMKALQVEYIDQALELLEATADWQAADQPTWTCEATDPVMWWLEDAAQTDVDRFSHFLREGRMGLSAMPYNGTPLSDLSTLSAQLRNKRILEERFGYRIRTANIHDVNGVAWPLADLLIDEGVELLIMATNNHFGRPVDGRPGVFRWEAPSGRSILVMNGAHYSMFDQVLYSWDRDLDRMQEGWSEYLAHLARIGYAHDFCYLTTTYPPQMWDNSPPNRAVAGLIRSWNEAGDRTPIRYVTPETLLERVLELPQAQVPTRRGAWNDHWGHGVGARAHEVKLHREARRHLAAAERITSLATDDPSPSHHAHRREASQRILEYEEHTFSHYLTAPETPYWRPIEGIKSGYAYAAHELAWLAQTEEMELLAGNDAYATRLPSMAFFNPAQEPQAVYVHVPREWRTDGEFLRVNRYQPEMGPFKVPGQVCGPVTVPAGSHMRVAMSDLLPVEDSDDIVHTETESSASELSGGESLDSLVPRFTGVDRTEIIETPWYRVRLDANKGRILSLIDKHRDREVLDTSGPTAFFDFIREHTDELVDDGSYAYYKRDMAREKFDLDCWQDGALVHDRATSVVRAEVKRSPHQIQLSTWFEAPSVRDLRRTITFRADSPRIGIEVSMEKLSDPDPEGVYFAIPLRMDADWRCHFDIAGVPVEIDDDQIGGANRNYVSVDNYISMHQGDHGVTLFCLDAPLAMAGGFHFGPPLDAVPRPRDPLMLAWAMNNYIDTNFARVQPGYVSLRYELLCHGAYDPVELARHADQLAHPVRGVPSTAAPQGPRSLLACSNPAVRVLDVRQDDFPEGGLIVRLLNVSEHHASATLEPGRHIVAATRCRPQGQPVGDPLSVRDGTGLDLEIGPLETIHIHLRLEQLQVS